MKMLVLSISFFILTVSPFTCSSELLETSTVQSQYVSPDDNDYEEENVEIDPIIMPTKP
ncbi:MAG TPA: hypothetical protein VJL37_12190 [Flavobacterium sp.]|nr:hypothetical protein [Flavobacterium sp.]